MNETLSDRMKKYENVTRQYATTRTPLIIRIDGRAFHTFTRNLPKPYCPKLRQSLVVAARYLLDDISTGVLAYIQSDEISILCLDYKNIKTNQWFDGNVQKISSISASAVTAAFNKEWSGIELAQFDARCFVIPESDVVNYFLWRYTDCVKNSVSAAAQIYFSHKELQNKTTTDRITMLREIGQPWEKLDDEFKNGTTICRGTEGTLCSLSNDRMTPLISHKMNEFLTEE